MPKSYSGDLRERVIDAVEIDGMSRRGAADRFDISVSSAVKWCSAGLEAHAEHILTLCRTARPDFN
jgi:transposase